MPTVPYDEIAEWYDAQVRAGTLLHDIALPALFDVVGDVRACEVCDLACGQGVVARELARQGAHVTGIHLSARLLAIAEREEAATPLGIAYRIDDAQRGDTLADASFDGVVCNMALMDMPDLDAVCHTVHRILHFGGWFAFSITHPCVQTPYSEWVTRPDGTMARASGDYFAEGFWLPAGAPGVRGRVGAYHRTLASHLNALARTGFCLDALAEPQAEGALAERVPAYRQLPAVLIAHAHTI